MGFLDLNIPYLESPKLSKQNLKLKETRTKLVGKAMELGYTGIAYNHVISGVMSDNDFCTISLIGLSSLIKLSPLFPSSVKLHREALSVPLASPFRQYTRVTVVADNVAQATLINSHNAVLKSYDLVAVRPTNQAALEQACQVSEVDIIAIDFGENKSFRLRQAMVKAATQRGVYFEIAYSDLLVDARTRRRVIDNVKLLVNWTGGKNLIFSSSAPSANELRGPYDVANLMSLIGVSMERAKAAISKNCRAIVASSLRRKHFYKGTIRVEAIDPDKPVDSKKPWYNDFLNWDPISSGDGDIHLEDIAKSFAVSDKVSKTVKAIDFSSVMDNIPSHGFHFKNFESENGVSIVDNTLLDAAPSNLIKTLTGKLFSPKDTREDLSKAQRNKSMLLNGITLRDDSTSSELASSDQAKTPLAPSSNLFLSNSLLEDNQDMDTGEHVLVADQDLLVHSDDGVDSCPVADHEQTEDVTMTDRDEGEHIDSNHRTLNEAMTGGVNNLRDNGVLQDEKEQLIKCNRGLEDNGNPRDDEVVYVDKAILVKCDKKDIGSKEMNVKAQDDTEVSYPTQNEANRGKGKSKQNRAFGFPFKQRPIPFVPGLGPSLLCGPVLRPIFSTKAHAFE